LRLGESLRANMVAVGGGAPVQLEVDAENVLYGIQVGADGAYGGTSNFRLHTIAKIGLYANDASNRAALRDPAGPLSMRDSRSQLSFVSELGLAATGRISEHWSLHSSYMWMLVSNVAQATELVRQTNFGTGRGIHTGHKVQYHGLMLSLQAEY